MQMMTNAVHYIFNSYKGKGYYITTEATVLLFVFNLPCMQVHFENLQSKRRCVGEK